MEIWADMHSDDTPQRRVMTTSTLRQIGGERLNVAAVWHARLHENAADETTWTEFTAWLEEADTNRLAFDLVEDLYADLDEAGTPIPLQTEAHAGITRFASWRAVRTHSVRASAAAVALLAATLLVAIGVDRLRVTPHLSYATGIGETKTVSLSDGSVVEMNTASTIAVTLSRSERRVDLNHGEAIFRVAKDPTRPFLVTVGDRDIRDIGTVFDVLRHAGRIVVMVAEGKVAISPHEAQIKQQQDTAVQLSPGDQFIVQEGSTQPVVSQIDPEAALSWRQGYLTYKDAPLSLVVSDLNRYFPHHIAVKDKNTGLRRFSGVLRVDNENAVLNRLTELLPLTIEPADDGSVILRLKP